MKKLVSLLLTFALLFSLSLSVGAAFTTSDALTILRAAAGTITLTTEQQAKYDLDGDGKITTADAVMILKSVVEASPNISNSEIKINQDIFSDIGEAYNKILEKRGPRTEERNLYNIILIAFENGYGTYAFSGNHPNNAPDVLCYGLHSARVNELFTNLDEPINALDINIPGLEIISITPPFGEDDSDNVVLFNYTASNNTTYKIYVFDVGNEKDTAIINPEKSNVSIYKYEGGSV